MSASLSTRSTSPISPVKAFPANRVQKSYYRQMSAAITEQAFVNIFFLVIESEHPFGSAVTVLPQATTTHFPRVQPAPKSALTGYMTLPEIRRDIFFSLGKMCFSFFLFLEKLVQKISQLQRHNRKSWNHQAHTHTHTHRVNLVKQGRENWFTGRHKSNGLWPKYSPDLRGLMKRSKFFWKGQKNVNQGWNYLGLLREFLLKLCRIGYKTTCLRFETHSYVKL